MLVSPGQIKNILVFRNDRFGEFLLNIPVFVALKNNFPASKLMVVVNSSVKELAKRIPVIDDIIIWDRHKYSIKEKLQFIRLLKTKRAEMAIILNPVKEFNFYTYFAGIPLRLGYNRKCALLLNYRVEDKKSEGRKHETEYNLELISRIGINPDYANPEFPLDIKPEDFSATRMSKLGIENKDFIVIHPWASNPQKEWPIENFEELIRKTALETKIKIVIIGGAQETNRAGELRGDLPLINLVGKTSLIELAGLLKRSRLLVTGDSGPMHLAAIMGIPVVAIFRKAPAALSAKRWGPIGKNHIVIEDDLIQNIKIGEVFDGVKKALLQ